MRWPGQPVYARFLPIVWSLCFHSTARGRGLCLPVGGSLQGSFSEGCASLGTACSSPFRYVQRFLTGGNNSKFTATPLCAFLHLFSFFLYLFMWRGKKHRYDYQNYLHCSSICTMRTNLLWRPYDCLFLCWNHCVFRKGESASILQGSVYWRKRKQRWTKEWLIFTAPVLLNRGDIGSYLFMYDFLFFFSLLHWSPVNKDHLVVLSTHAQQQWWPHILGHLWLSLRGLETTKSYLLSWVLARENFPKYLLPYSATVHVKIVSCHMMTKHRWRVRRKSTLWELCVL